MSSNNLIKVAYIGLDHIDYWTKGLLRHWKLIQPTVIYMLIIFMNALNLIWRHKSYNLELKSIEA